MSDHILFKVNRFYQNVYLGDISHITVNGDCSTIHFKKHKISVSASLKVLHERLPDHFLRVNRNTIINLNQISRISYSDRMIELKHADKIEISVRRVMELKLRLSQKTLRLSVNQ